MKVIIVNNPAARSGGALTILKEFLEKISKSKCNRKFYVFVSLEELKKYETKNLKVIVIAPQGFKNRIIWDNYGLKKYLNKALIKPNIFLSIQNTGVNIYKKIPQLLYYHQSLSIVNLKWSFFKKNERLYWMYENIYPLFIKQYLGRIEKIIVQTEWVKNSLNKKFNYPLEKIILMKPEIKKIDIDKVNKIEKNKFRIFYPATPLIYKNHKIIIEALGEIKKEENDIDKKIECIFTFSKGESLELDYLIERYNLESIIKLVGKISYEKVLEYYKNSDLMVFPSYLETFGLPLAEAQQFQLPIITLDLPYAREVLGNYKKCEFINNNDFNELKNRIEVLI